MKEKIYIFAIIGLFLHSCSSQSDSTSKPAEASPCSSRSDTTLHLEFSLDTTTSDFLSLLSFIEKRGQFSRYNRKRKIDSSIKYEIFLQRILCDTIYIDPPMENWFLHNIFSISYLLTSQTPAKGTKDFFPGFRITQLNFSTQKEAEIAAAKIQEVRWGDPQHKWNDWYFVKGNKRIYILESYVAMFSEVTKKYRDIIEKEWVKKNSK